MKRTQDFKNTRLSWCFALVWIFLTSQFFGLQHRLEHTRWQVSQTISPAESQLNTTFSSTLFASISSPNENVFQTKSAAFYNAGFIDAAHSCIALDAACLADALNSFIHKFVSPDFLAPSRVSTPAILWDALFVAHFRSRAPPVFL